MVCFSKVFQDVKAIIGHILFTKAARKRKPRSMASRRVKSANRKRNRDYGLELMSNMTDVEFQSNFRLSRIAFADLLGMVSPYLESSKKNKDRILPVTKLAATLRWLGGGSYLDISNTYGLDHTNFFNDFYILWPTIDAIEKCLPIGFNLNIDMLRETAAGFSKYSYGHMTGCVMAVDGWVCKTRCPTREEVGLSISQYRNRKCAWGIVVMAGCDHKCRFTFVSANSCGSTNDVIAWEFSELKIKIDEGVLPEEFYFIGTLLLYYVTTSHPNCYVY